MCPDPSSALFHLLVLVLLLLWVILPIVAVFILCILPVLLYFSDDCPR